MTLAALATGTAAFAAPVTRTLSNGMRVVASAEPGSGRAAAVLMVRAGDADDPPGAAGAARMLSRILLDPANHRAPGRFNGLMTDGGFWSDSEPDVTSYSVVTTPGGIAAALRLLSLTVEEPVWNNTLVIRAVQREAALEREEAPDDWQQDFMAWQAKAGLPGPPASDVSPPDRETLRPFYERLYVPDNMVLAVVGDVSLDGVLAQAEALFTLPAARSVRFETRRPRPSLAEPRAPTGRYAFAGRRAPAATSPDAPAVEVLAAALGRGKTSSLFRRLREGEGTGYESGVVYPRRLTDSGLALFALAPGRARIVAAELERIWREGQTPPEGGWDAARARAAHSYIAQHQTARDRAYWLAFWETAGPGAAHDEAYADEIRSVPDETLAAAARRWLSASPDIIP